MKSVAVDFDGQTQEHFHYVALSRVVSLEGLFLINFNPSKVKSSQIVKNEMEILRK